MSRHRLSIEHLSLFGMPPSEHVALAAELGCAYISLVAGSAGTGPEGHPPWSLVQDGGLRRELIGALDAHGVSISLGDGLVIRPDREAADLAQVLDALAEVGTARIATVSFDPDLDRSFDQFAQLADLAHERGMPTVLEPVPTQPVSSLEIALAAVEHVGRSDFTLLIDTMHVARMGATGADLRSLPPGMIGYVHLCDAPQAPPADYIHAAMTERLPPGEGALPLDDLVAALSDDVVIGLEVPMHAEAQAGVPVRARMSRCIEGAQRLLVGADKREPR